MSQPREVNPNPWTRTEVMKQLRAAGWRRMASDAAVYVHDDGGQVDIDAYVRAAGGVVWRSYARTHTLPATDGRIPF